MNLADAIVETNKRRGSDVDERADEFGIPIPVPLTAQYLVARTILRDEGASPIEKLHLRGAGWVWKNHTPIVENNYNFYVLTGVTQRLPAWVFPQFWWELKKFLPTLDRSKIIVGKGLLWDVDKGGFIKKSTSGKIGSTKKERKGK